MGLLSKIKSKTTKDPLREAQDSDSLTDRSSSPTIIGSNAFVGRPPALDSKTERELRQACALILQDLKPSGHDIEDTRMKSDILLDEEPDLDPYRLNHGLKPVHAKQKPVEHPPRSHSAADWVMHDEGNPLRLHPNNAIKAPAAVTSKHMVTQKASAALEPANLSYSRPKSTALPARTTKIIVPESPQAPAQTMAPSVMPASSPRPVQRPESTSTSPSTQYTSVSSDRNKSVSTTTPFTPSLSSKRVSENDKLHSQATSATAKDGQWMKESVDKRRQAEADTTTGAAYTVNGYASAAAPPPRVKSPPMQIAQIVQRDSFLAARTMSLNSHPISSGMTSPPINTRSSSSYSMKNSSAPSPPQTVAADVAPPPPAIARPINIPNRRSSKAMSGRQSTELVVKETERSPPAASPESKEIPPVPRLDTIRLNSFTNRTSFPAKQLSPGAVPVEPHTPKDDQTRMMRQQLSNMQISQAAPKSPISYSNGPLRSPGDSKNAVAGQQYTSRTSDLEVRTGPSSTVNRVSTSQWPMSTFTDPTANTSSPIESQPPKRPLKHQHDSSIVVKDFYRPNVPNANNNPTSKTTTGNGPTAARDPTPADFDYLMNVMNYTRESVHNSDTPPQSSKADRPEQDFDDQNLEDDKVPAADGSQHAQYMAQSVQDARSVSPLPSSSSLDVPYAQPRTSSMNVDPPSGYQPSFVTNRASLSPLPSRRPKPMPFTKSNDNLAALKEFAAVGPPAIPTSTTSRHAKPGATSNGLGQDADSTALASAPRRNTIHAPTDTSAINPTEPLPLPISNVIAINNSDEHSISTSTSNTVRSSRSRAKSTSNKASGSGFSKLLHKLGGGDMPSPPPNPTSTSAAKPTTNKSITANTTKAKARRKSSVNMSAGYSYSDKDYDSGRLGSLGGSRWADTDEYWEDNDERACAAPVVGFGRGR